MSAKKEKRNHSIGGEAPRGPELLTCAYDHSWRNELTGGRKNPSIKPEQYPGPN